MYERNINQLLLSHPQQGTWPETCALTWNPTGDLSVHEKRQLSHTNQGSCAFSTFYFSFTFSTMALTAGVLLKFLTIHNERQL